MAKIPTLVPDQHRDGIYDSFTICEYLEAEAAASVTKVMQDQD